MVSLRGRRTWCAGCRPQANRAAGLACTPPFPLFRILPLRPDGASGQRCCPDHGRGRLRIGPHHVRRAVVARVPLPVAGGRGRPGGGLAGCRVGRQPLDVLFFLRSARRSSSGRAPLPLLPGGEPASLTRPLPACAPGADSAGPLAGQQVCPDRSTGRRTAGRPFFPDLRNLAE